MIKIPTLFPLFLAALLLGQTSTSADIPDALDQPDWEWTTGGDASWFAQNDITHPSGFSAQSGSLADNQTSWLETVVEGPGVLTFAWKTSSEWHYDPVTFSINGETKLRASGETDWEDRTAQIGPGPRTLRWTYSKNDSRSNGTDAVWLAHIRWEPISNFALPDPASQQLPSDGGAYEIAIQSDSSWNIASTPDWLVASPTTGTGDGTIAIEVAPNTGIAPRSGTIRIGENEHHIVQAARPDPQLSIDFFQTKTEGGLVRFSAEPGIRYKTEFSSDLREWNETVFQLHEIEQTVATVPEFRELEITLLRPNETEANSREFWRIVAHTPPAHYAFIPAGPFQMGDARAETALFMAESSPAHTVSTDSFFISPNPISFAEWQEVVAWALAHGYDFDNAGQRGAASDWNELPDSPENNRHPVVAISWYDALKWCNAKSEMSGAVPAYYIDAEKREVYRTGKLDLSDEHVRWNAPGYRLPREAEWEKAARGGLTGKRWPWGDDEITTAHANFAPAPGETLGTNPPGAFPPNTYGLEDTSGNIWEWTWDWHAAETYRNRADDRSTAPDGPANGFQRVVRGGSWDSSAGFSRVSSRLGIGPETALAVQGFRPVFGNGRENLPE